MTSILTTSETTTTSTPISTPSTTTTTSLTPRAHTYPSTSPIISINARYPRHTDALLPEDIFLPVSHSDTLLTLFRRALAKHPTYIGRYILRRDKSVIVLCKDHANSTYAKPATFFASVAHRYPVRLIFCVYPNDEVIRALDVRKSYSIAVNVQLHGEDVDLFRHDIPMEVTGAMTTTDIWNQLVANFDHLSPDFVAMRTRQKEGRVPVRFGKDDLVADVVRLGVRRFVFEAEGVEPRRQGAQHHDQGRARHEHGHHGHHRHERASGRKVHFDDDVHGDSVDSFAHGRRWSHADEQRASHGFERRASHAEHHAHDERKDDDASDSLEECQGRKVVFRFKPFFRFRRDACPHGYKKFQWGLCRRCS